MRRTWQHKAGRIAFYVLVVLILIYTIFPFYWAFVSSIKPDNEINSSTVTYWPNNPTFENYTRVFEADQFIDAIINSVIVAFSVTALSLVVAQAGRTRAVPSRSGSKLRRIRAGSPSSPAKIEAERGGATN